MPHAIFIAARIAEGLHYAHTLAGEDGRPLNIVNRDVSPSNVRLSYMGDVKLLDFGIARLLSADTSEPATRLQIARPHPESAGTEALSSAAIASRSSAVATSFCAT